MRGVPSLPTPSLLNIAALRPGAMVSRSALGSGRLHFIMCLHKEEASLSRHWCSSSRPNDATDSSLYAQRSGRVSQPFTAKDNKIYKNTPTPPVSSIVFNKEDTKSKPTLAIKPINSHDELQQQSRHTTRGSSHAHLLRDGEKAVLVVGGESCSFSYDNTQRHELHTPAIINTRFIL